MPEITYIDHQGERRTLDASDGETIMEAAIKNSIPGIEAECGGACACATCHIFVDENFRSVTGEASDMEASMLEFADNVQSNSRLACQIKITNQMDGLIVRTPANQ